MSLALFFALATRPGQVPFAKNSATLNAFGFNRIKCAETKPPNPQHQITALLDASNNELDLISYLARD